MFEPETYDRAVKLLTIAASAAVLLALTGCAATTDAATKPTQTPTPTPTEQVATEGEVASVIAEYAPDWQDVIDTASECRLVYVTGTGDPGQDYVCETREETMGVTAGLASRSLNELNVPSSMESLVADTDSVLTQIAAIDLESSCGDDGWGGDDSTCNSALGDRFALYTQLDSKLSAWSPYL